MQNQTKEEPRIYETKEQLMRIIQEKDEIIADLQAQLNTGHAALRETSMPGWVISTKNKAYVGNMFGLHFENGRAFLPASRPDAKMLLSKFTNDFGYQAEVITSNEFESQRTPVQKQDKSFLEKVSQPNIVS